MSEAQSIHPAYGPCDGFGPLWTCSECTGIIARHDGTYVATHTNEEIDADRASDMLGDFLLDKAELAAVAGWGCCDNPEDFARFVRDTLTEFFPGRPYRAAPDAPTKAAPQLGAEPGSTQPTNEMSK